MSARPTVAGSFPAAVVSGFQQLLLRSGIMRQHEFAVLKPPVFLAGFIASINDPPLAERDSPATPTILDESEAAADVLAFKFFIVGRCSVDEMLQWIPTSLQLLNVSSAVVFKLEVGIAERSPERPLVKAAVLKQ